MKRDPAWFPAEGEQPLSDSQIRRYSLRARKIVHAKDNRRRATVVAFHLAKLRRLYSKAILQDDVRTALAILKDEAEFLGLYERGRILKLASQNLSAEQMGQLAALLQQAEGAEVDG